MFAQRTNVLKISLVAILSAFAVEFVFGITSNSLALLTDSVHALLDSVVTAVLLVAARYAIKPPDAEHTYGHGKVESLGGLIGGIAIFLIAAFFIYESITRMQSTEPMIIPGMLALVAAVYTIGIDVFRIVLLKKTINRIGGSTLRADFYHAFLDLGSTLVVIAGIVLANIGVHDADFAAALVLGILLCVLSFKLIHRTAQELTDIISPELVRKVREIATSTGGVLDVGQVLMRRSGDVIFADVTISLRADVSFDRAHEISSHVEDNIKRSIPNSEITVHFEPSWKDVPLDSKIYDIASGVAGVKGIHNVSHHTAGGDKFVSLHVMVDRQMTLEDAHNLADAIESKIRGAMPEIENITIHLEPHIAIPTDLKSEPKTTDEEIIAILKEHPEVKKIGRIVTLNFEDLKKIDINCSFERRLTIERVHDITSQIEHSIRGRFKNSVITIHPEPF
ncbi:cation diffusion facilitator family transporter [Candidatus Nitrosotenuis cloacae]|uniref:cation diffusion facilitator family transporter n=1 Tax=Candidatus Nitrosotenuis cloacae TaxID=1603555 RepID=UPI002280EA7B|nr:cation diffusion facilitator family transporter [Candidatus Nitrosotenuis cloacae]